MIILAADTSTEYNCVAVCDENGVLSEVCVKAGRAHSEKLLETVDWVLSNANVALEDLDHLAISVGPGSFTGLRIGVSTWKGLSVATKIPLIPIPTLDAYARAASLHQGRACPMLDAKMDEVFTAHYDYNGGVRTKLTDDLVCSIDTLLDKATDDTLFWGEGAARYAGEIKARFPDATVKTDEPPRATYVASEAFALLKEGAITEGVVVEPVYLRLSQAEEALERKKEALTP